MNILLYLWRIKMAKKIKSIMLDWEQYQISGEDAGAIRKDILWTSYVVNNIRVGTQAEFDAIETKALTTLYHIVDWDTPVPPTPVGKRYMELQIDESKSDPAQMVTLTSEDAINCTDWDSFFGMYPVLLDASGNEFKKLNPANFQQDIDGNDVSSYTADGNYEVMIAFPRMWYKASKEWDIITINLTNEDNVEWYCYLAHQRGSGSSVVNKDKFYLGAYEWYVSWSKLHSWYGKVPTTSQTIWEFRTNAHNTGTGFEQMAYYQHTLLQIMYLFKYRNTNTQATIGQGYTSGSAKQNTGATYNKGMTYGEQSTTSRMKLFGLEDIWWNVTDWMDGLASNSSGEWAVNNDNFQDDWHGTGHTVVGVSFTTDSYIKKMWGTTHRLFIPNETGATETTYYSDKARVNSGARVACVGGIWNSGSDAGLFRLNLADAASYSSSTLGSRLMFL